jgi:hypothetical protein
MSGKIEEICRIADQGTPQTLAQQLVLHTPYSLSTGW